MPDIGIRVVVLGTAEARRNVAAFQSDIGRLEGEIRHLTGISGGLGTEMTRLGNTLSGFGRSLAITVTAPIIAMTGALVNAGIQFEDAFAGVGKTVDGVMTPLGELTALGQEIREEFRELALEVPLSAVALAELGEVVGQLGVKADDVAEVTRIVAMLGATTELSAEEAATGLIRFGNIMEGTALDVEDFLMRAGSAVVALGNASVSTEGEILNLSLRLAAAGDRANFSSQEILAWATTLSDLGVRSEMGGSAVSRAITEMVFAVQTGSDNLETFASVTGQSVDQFVAAFEDDASAALLNFIGKLEEGIRTGNVNKDMLLAMGLSGVRAIDVMGRLGDATDIFTKNLETSQKAWDDQIALQEEFNKRAATVQSMLQILKNQFFDLGITLFDLVRTDLIALIQGIGDVIQRFKELDPETQKTILLFAAIAAAVGPVLIIVGGLIAVLGTIVTAITALISPVGLAVAGILALGAAFVVALGPGLITLVQSAIDKVMEFFGTLTGREFTIDIKSIFTGADAPVIAPAVDTTLVDESLAAMREEFASLGMFGAQAPAPGAQGTPTDLNEARREFQSLGQPAAQPDFLERQAAQPEGEKNFLEKLIPPEMMEQLEKFGETVEKVFTQARDLIQSFVDVIVEVAWPDIKKAFDELTATLNDLGIDWEDVFKALATGIGVTVVVIVGIITGLITALALGMRVIAETFRNVMVGVQMIFEGFLAFFENIIVALIHLFRGEFDEAGAAFEKAGQGFYKIVDGLFIALFSIIAGAVELVLGLILGFAEGFVALIVKMKERVTGEIDETGRGLVEAIRTAKDDMLGFISDLVLKVIQYFENLQHELVGGSIVPDMVDAILAHIERLKTQFIDKVTTLIEKVKKFFADLKTTLITSITDIKNGLLAQAIETVDGVVAEFMRIKAIIDKVVVSILSKFDQIVEGFAGVGAAAFAAGKLIGMAVERMIEALNNLWATDRQLRGSPQYRIYYAFDDFGKLMRKEDSRIAGSIDTISGALSKMDAGSITQPNTVATTQNVDRSNSVVINGVPLTGEIDILTLMNDRLMMQQDRA